MDRNYKKKTHGRKYTNATLVREALAKLPAGSSLKNCSRIYNIPRRTLARHRDWKVVSPGTRK